MFFCSDGDKELGKRAVLVTPGRRAVDGSDSCGHEPSAIAAELVPVPPAPRLWPLRPQG